MTALLLPVRHNLLELVNVRHGFSTREGGVSEGIYESLNCGPGSNDMPEHVAENRKRVALNFSLPPERLVTLHQCHSDRLVTIDSQDALTQAKGQKADGLVTNQPNIILGVLTADCGPVLLADEEGKIAAAVHAGWKGALAGILIRAVEAMEKLGAARHRIRAVLGPCIAQPSYEVDQGFYGQFNLVVKGAERFFMQGKDEAHYQFNLPAFVLFQLEEAGLHPSQMAWTGHDTYADEAHFYSYRRTTHREEKDYGRQLSCIALMD